MGVDKCEVLTATLEISLPECGNLSVAQWLPAFWRRLPSKARFKRQSFPRASSQRRRICGWENPGVLTSYTLVSVLIRPSCDDVRSHGHRKSLRLRLY
jgi:hypothetical protein